MAESVHHGSCFCGKVSYKVTGTPLLRAYCHCTLCQRLNASPFILTLHFSPEAFSWTHAEPHNAVLDSYSVETKPWKKRWRCSNCGCTVASHHAKLDRWSIWGAQLERDAEGKIKGWEEVKPTHHIFYGTRMLDMNDGLSKWAGYEGKSERIA